MINTLSPPTSMTKVKRKGKDGQSSQIPCPESINLYIKFMGGVDLADARCKTYTVPNTLESRVKELLYHDSWAFPLMWWGVYMTKTLH